MFIFALGIGGLFLYLTVLVDRQLDKIRHLENTIYTLRCDFSENEDSIYYIYKNDQAKYEVRCLWNDEALFTSENLCKARYKMTEMGG